MSKRRVKKEIELSKRREGPGVGDARKD